MKKIITLLTLATLSLLAVETRYNLILSEDNITLSYTTDTNACRIYLYGDTLQPLLGYTSDEGKGLLGFEKYITPHFEKYSGVKLNINLALQQRVEKILDDYKHELKADEIIVGVMESATGKLRVAASSNRYNPHTATEEDIPNLFQKFSAYRYEPGAVMMPIVIAAALQRGLVEPHTIIATNGGRLEFENGRFVTDTIKNDLLTLDGILTNYSNVGIAKIAYRFSGYEFRESLEKFGLHQACYVELMHNHKGFLQSAETFEQGRYRANTAYGYGMLASFTQLMRAYSTFNNRGVRVTPRLVHSLLKGKTEVPAEPLDASVKAVRQNVADRVHEMLVTNVHQGFAKQAQIAGLETGGMGSTAYIAKDGHYVKEYHSSFYGFANDADGHTYTIGVLVIRPRDPQKFYASRSAVPVFKTVVTAMVEQNFLTLQEVSCATSLK